MNNKKKTNIIICIIIAVTLAITLVYYPSVPDIIPTHWGVNGQVDGTGPKYMLFVFLGITVVLNAIMLFAEKIDPRRDNYARFTKVFNIFRVFFTALMCGLVLLTIAFSFDAEFTDMNSIMYAVMGAMFMLLGNYMPKVKHNYTFGIKTPWTLDSETVWNKTHRMCGPVWFAGGVVCMAMVFVKNSTVTFAVWLVSTLAMVIIPTVYSYLEYQKEKGKK